MIKRALDWKLAWIQSLLIVGGGIGSYLWIPPLAMKISGFGFINTAGGVSEYFNIGNKILQALLIMIVIASRVWKSNKDVVLTQKYAQHSHSFLGYWYCRNVLRFSKCSLRMVPIPLQFRPILSGLFPDYIYDDGVDDNKEPDHVTVSVRNDKEITSRVNLVIADTYEIKTAERIPADQASSTTYEVKRKTDGVRRKSDKLKEEVIRVLRGVPVHVREVNVYSTLNTYNCYKICREAFDTGARDCIETIYVYNQGKHDGRTFEKPVKIKL